jgi:hypothetical protein
VLYFSFYFYLSFSLTLFMTLSHICLSELAFSILDLTNQSCHGKMCKPIRSGREREGGRETAGERGVKERKREKREREREDRSLDCRS